jgi:hypothetical protein
MSTPLTGLQSIGAKGQQICDPGDDHGNRVDIHPDYVLHGLARDLIRRDTRRARRPHEPPDRMK